MRLFQNLSIRAKFVAIISVTSISSLLLALSLIAYNDIYLKKT